MALEINTGEFTANNTTSTQEITGLGFQPKVIFFFSSYCTSRDSWLTDGIGLVSVVDDTSGVPEPNKLRTNFLSNANDFKRYRNNIVNHNFGYENGLTNIGLGNVSSLDIDGFTITWDATWGANTATYRYVALGGSDLLNYGFSYHDGHPTSTGNWSATDLSFTPNHLFNMMTWCDTTGDLEGTLTYNFGYANETNAVSMGISSQGDVNPSVTASALHSDGTFIGCPKSSADGYYCKASLVSFNSDGFTLNFSVIDGPDSLDDMAFYAIQTTDGTGDINCGKSTFNTSTGTKSVSGMGFIPRAGLLMHAGAAYSNSYAVDGMWGAGVFGNDGADGAAFTFSADNENTSNGTNSQRYDTADSVLVSADAGTASITDEATLSSVDNDGFTLNWTTVSGTAKEFLYIGFWGGDVPIQGVSHGVKTSAGCCCSDCGVQLPPGASRCCLCVCKKLCVTVTSLATGTGTCDCETTITDVEWNETECAWIGTLICESLSIDARFEVKDCGDGDCRLCLTSTCLGLDGACSDVTGTGTSTTSCEAFTPGNSTGECGGYLKDCDQEGGFNETWYTDGSNCGDECYAITISVECYPYENPQEGNIICKNCDCVCDCIRIDYEEPNGDPVSVITCFSTTSFPLSLTSCIPQDGDYTGTGSPDTVGQEVTIELVRGDDGCCYWEVTVLRGNVGEGTGTGTGTSTSEHNVQYPTDCPDINLSIDVNLGDGNVALLEITCAACDQNVAEPGMQDECCCYDFLQQFYCSVAPCRRDRIYARITWSDLSTHDEELIFETTGGTGAPCVEQWDSQGGWFAEDPNCTGGDSDFIENARLFCNFETVGPDCTYYRLEIEIESVTVPCDATATLTDCFCGSCLNNYDDWYAEFDVAVSGCTCMQDFTVRLQAVPF